MKLIKAIEKSEETGKAKCIAITPDSRLLLIGYDKDLKIFDFKNNFILLKSFKNYHNCTFSFL